MPAQCLLHLGVVLALSGSTPLPADVPTFSGGESCFDACQQVARAEQIASRLTFDIGQCGAGRLEQAHTINAGLSSETGHDAPWSDRCMVVIEYPNEVAALMSRAVSNLYKECAPPKGTPPENCEVPISPSNGKGSCAPHAVFAIPAG